MLEETVEEKQESRTAYWLSVDLSSLHEQAVVDKHFAELLFHKEFSLVEETGSAHIIPEYGASKLKRKPLEGLCASLWQSTWDAVRPLGRTPSGLFMVKHRAVVSRVVQAVASYYTRDAMTRNIAGMREAERRSDTSNKKPTESKRELSSNELLIETGVKTALSLVFTLLQHSWVQSAWQRQLEDQLRQQGAVALPPTINLPSQALQSILTILRSFEPLSLSNAQLLSPLALSSLQQAKEFLLTAMSPDSLADSKGKQLAAEILLNLALLEGRLPSLLTWISACLSCLKAYTNGGEPSLSLDCCHHSITVLRTKLLTSGEEQSPPSFEPSTAADGTVSILEFILFLMQELSRQCQVTTDTLRASSKEPGGVYISDTSEVYAFGSNSNSQLDTGSIEKFPQPTAMPHMNNAQLVLAGQYCTFLLYSDGTVKACGKGSNGRLGLGNSDSQHTLTAVNTFPPSTHIRQLATSCGGDSHSMAVDTQGAVYSWGDGEYGKLGHGNSSLHKIPKLIAGLAGKVVLQVACGNRHSAAVTSTNELFTWGGGDHGRLGHDSTQTVKTPQKVSAIGPVCQVSCGSAHTLALSQDSTTVWSFGAGSSGCLGHGGTDKQLKPKIIEALQGTIMCCKVCAGKDFSLILSTNGQVYSFGNSSAVGKGITNPSQSSPWLITTLANEGIVDISASDAHCLALSQSGEVFSWGSNNMRQCGLGTTDTSSVTTPTRVPLSTIQVVQQISAGSSHSIVWTALPTDRKVATVWYWPFCVSVTEQTFEQLVGIIDQYQSVTDPSPPFTIITQQRSLLVSSLSLLRTHLSQCAPPLGATSSLVCGSQVQPMRELLLHLIDCHLPADIDQVCSHTLETGASLLLPPVRERVTLLLSLLPEDPKALPTISNGQRRQIDILLNGLLSDTKDTSLLFADDGDTPDYATATLELCSRMILYIDGAMRAQLAASSTCGYSGLMESFAQFINLMFVHTSARHRQSPSQNHLDWFSEVLVTYSIPLVDTITIAATNTACPHQFVSSMEDVVLGFLVYSYPMMVLTACSQHDYLLQLARVIHSLIMVAPPDLIDQLEQDELTHDPQGLEETSEEMSSVWSKLCQLERALCCAAARQCLQQQIVTDDGNVERTVLAYCPPERDDPLLQHLLCNGIAGGSLQQDVLLWVSLCRTLPYPPTSDEDEELWSLQWPSVLTDYDDLVCGGWLPVDITIPVDYFDIEPFSSTTNTSPLLPSSLLSLAVGSTDCPEAVSIYNTMMAVANLRDWNTCSDEDSLPQLRQVSCAVLACLLYHTGLYHSLTRPGKPRREVVDVYRAVFTVRKSLFLHRPIPDSDGETDPLAVQWFDELCATICCYMFFLLCVVGQAVPHDDLPIVPGAASTERQSSAEHLTTPVSVAAGSKITRLYSQPASVSSPPVVALSELSDTHAVFPVSTTEWSLDEVKRSLSLLRWQRQRLDQLEVKGSPAGRSTLRSSVIDAIVGLVSPMVYRSGEEAVCVLSRVDILAMLLTQSTRAKGMKSLLQSVSQFLECEGLLPSARLSYHTCCVSKTFINCNINCAPATLQHEVKQLYHGVLQRLLAPLSSTAVPNRNGYRSHLLALLWLATTHDTADLKLVLTTTDLYHQLVLCTGDTNTAVLPIVFQGEGELAAVLKRACSLAVWAIALQTSLNSELMLSSDQLLTTPTKYLYGFLEGYLGASSPRAAEKQQQQQLGDYLGYLCALASSGLAILTSSNTPCNKWCDLLLQCVGVNSDGIPNVASLRPRLLAVELLGVVCCEATPTAQLMEALLSLLYQSVFTSPVSSLSQLVTQPLTMLTRTIKHSPFQFDANHCQNCSTSIGYYSDDCCVQPVTAAEGDGVGYALSKIVLDCGSYTWKVTRGSFECPPFWVGVAVKPLMADINNVTSSDQVWLLEGLSGQLYHGGRMVGGEEELFTVNAQDTITVLYDTGTGTGGTATGGTGTGTGTGGTGTGTGGTGTGTLSFAINDNAPKLAFTNVYSDKPLCAVILFNRPAVPSSADDIKFFFESFSNTRSLPASMAGLHEEAAMSGYPFLSPSSMAVCHALYNLLYKLQEDQDKWRTLILDTITDRLKEMGTRVDEFLLTLADHRDTAASSSLAALITWLCEWVWPCLALLGGVNSGFCVGGECTDEEGMVCVIVTTPTSNGEVKIQELNSSCIDPRSVALSELKLAKSRVLSVERSYLTPSLLTNLAHLASLHDHPHNLATILTSLQDTISSSHILISSYPYLHYCEQLLRLVAVRSLNAILHGCSDLLLYTAPSLDELATGPEDSSDLATTLVDVMKCLVTRSVQPAVLRPVLDTAELAHVSDVVGYEHLLRIMDERDQETHCHDATEWSYDKLQQAKDTSPCHRTAALEPISSPEPSLTPTSPPPPVASSSSLSQPADFAVVDMLLEMGFMRTIVNAAMRRCEVPDGVQTRQRMDLLINWILEHPEAAIEDTTPPTVLEEPLVIHEAAQTMAANELLSVLGEGYFDNGDTAPPAISIDHAPDLLDGPSITDDVPDPLSAGDVTSSLNDSLLPALRLDQPNPPLQLHRFDTEDPLGAAIVAPHKQKGEPKGAGGLSTACQSVVDQATHLKTVQECRSAQNRLISAAMSLAARQLILYVIEALTLHSHDALYRALISIGLADVSKLVHLLRLVHGGRVPGASSYKDSIAVAIAAVMARRGRQSALVQACCRDLLAVAVGGVEFMKQGRKRKQHRTDLTVLANPEISITQRLVETITSSSNSSSSSSSNMAVTSSSPLADALSACILSLKLEPQYQLWALKQLLNLFAAQQPLQRDAAVPATTSPQLLSGHQAQVMSCTATSDRILTISEDDSILMWREDHLSDPVSLPLATSQEELPILPILELNTDCSIVAASRGSQVYMWRLNNPPPAGPVCATVVDIVSCLQWQRGHKDTLLVGMLGGGVVRILVNNEQPVVVEEGDKFTYQPREGAVKIIETSHNGDHIVIATAGGCHLLLCSRNGELVHHIDEQVDMMAWSPTDTLLATLGSNGVLKLWDNGLTQLLLHQFNEYTVTNITWHSVVGNGGSCLLAGGCSNGATHLWTISSSAMVDHTAVLSRPQYHDSGSSVTRLCFSATSLLAAGYSNGCVAVWDTKEKDIVKVSPPAAALGGVVSMCWTTAGLVWCTLNSTTPHLLTPGIKDYSSVIFSQRCRPLLTSLGADDPASAPCLHALMRNLPSILQQQYQYENCELCSNHQLVHSEYLQLLTALVHGLELDSVLTSSSPLLPIHCPPQLNSEWQWLRNFTAAVKMADCFIHRSTPLPASTALIHHVDPTDKYHPLDNSVWSVKMDTAILQWVTKRPSDWRPGGGATVYTWGKNSWKQLGHSDSETCKPTVAEDWTNAQTVVAGCCCSYIINYDGSLQSVGRAGYNGDGSGSSELTTVTALNGIRVSQVVAGPRYDFSVSGGYALALSSSGAVYSWGKGQHGRLGHSSPNEECRIPKLVKGLAGKDIVMLACCDNHCAALSSNGDLYTFGNTEHGKTGRSNPQEGTPSKKVGMVTQYLSDNEQELADVKIGYVACGLNFTAALDQNRDRVFVCGKVGAATHSTMTHLSYMDQYGPYTKVFGGEHGLILINKAGKLCGYGKVHDTMVSGYLDILADEVIVDIQGADQYMLALTNTGRLYSFGKSSSGAGQLGYATSATVATPKLVESLSDAVIKQISAGIRHVCTSTLPPLSNSTPSLCAPLAVPSQYPDLSVVSYSAIYGRMLILDQFSQSVLQCWRLFHQYPAIEGPYHVNPLELTRVRALVSHTLIERQLHGVMCHSMSSRSVGPTITVRRLEKPDNPVQPIFTQICHQILKKDPADLRCSTRAWKVVLVGEGADDAGGVFDETMAEMCKELESNTLSLLIPTPNSRNKCGFNTDRYVLNPECCSRVQLAQFKFLGIMLGVAIRTKRPLDLHLAAPMWKLLAGMSLCSDDLEEIDVVFTQTLYGIRDIDKGGISETDFSEMIPLESYEALSMSGKFVPVVHGGHNMPLTFHNRRDYVEKALHFRLHELDRQVAAVKEGMSCIVPVPLLSLLSADKLETLVCGYEEIDVEMLKKVAKYKGGLTETDQLVQWLWQTLDTFTNEERVLFLRFVSGRSRLPTHASEIGQRFQISKSGGENSLPTAQTCFFQLRIPSYSCQEQLAEKLLYSIQHCRSIDMDNYMLARNTSGSQADSDIDDLYSDTDDDDDTDYF